MSISKVIPLMLVSLICTGCGSSSSDSSPESNSSEVLSDETVGENGSASEGAGASDNSGTSGEPIGTDNTETSGGVGDTSSSDVTDESDSDSDSDSDSEAEGSDSSSETDGADTSNGNDTANAVCAEVSTDITYELFGSECNCIDGYGRYVPSGSPGIYGWDGNNYCDLTASEEVERISLLVPYSSSAPVIDGDAEFFDDEWSRAAASSWSTNKADMNLVRNLLFTNVDGYLDGSRTADFRISHDTKSLYVEVRVRNEHRKELTGLSQVYNDSTDPSDDDSIEIFIDGDNSKGSSYDGVNDFHSKLIYLESSPNPVSGPNSASGLDLYYRTSNDTGISGDTRSWWYEIRINLASAGITVGKPFGFDIQLNDDDNGGAVDARFAWAEPSGSALASSNPGILGTVVLTGCADLNNCDFEQSLTGQ